MGRIKLSLRAFLPAMIFIAAFMTIVYMGAKTAAPKTGGGDLLVLLYHTFSDQPEQDPGLYTTAEKFERDIQALLEGGLESISLYDYADGSYDPERRYFAITFDDGYLSNYQVAFPILQRLGCYADIFKNTANDYLDHHFSYDQAREMEESGLISIHSHLPDHVIHPSEYPIEEFTLLLRQSFETLERELGPRRHRLFAPPFGDYTQKTYNAAAGENVKLQFVQERHFDAPDLILRINIAHHTDITRLLR